MKTIPFFKMSGSGNDFILIDNREAVVTDDQLNRLVVGACLAETGNSVRCVDSDEGKIARLQRGDIPIYEPGLEELVLRNVAEERLSFTTNLEEAVHASSVIFIAVGTPPEEDGSADLKHVLEVARDIGRAMNEDKILVNKLYCRLYDPARWQVVVFERDGYDQNLIKRILGLPGEEIDIRDGDVIIDGKIPLKPPAVQEALLIPVFAENLDLIARQHELGDLVEELVAASTQVIEEQCLPVIAQHAPFAADKMVLGGKQ